MRGAFPRAVLTGELLEAVLALCSRHAALPQQRQVAHVCIVLMRLVASRGRVCLVLTAFFLRVLLFL